MDANHRIALVHGKMQAQPGRVWSRKDLADAFGVSKELVDAPLAVLVAKGRVEENRYQRPLYTNPNSWYFGYTLKTRVNVETDKKVTL